MTASLTSGVPWGVLQAELEGLLAELYSEAMERYLIGTVSEEWRPRGLSMLDLEREPTPVEKAMVILDPHLIYEPLYQP